MTMIEATIHRSSTKYNSRFEKMKKLHKNTGDGDIFSKKNI